MNKKNVLIALSVAIPLVLSACGSATPQSDEQKNVPPSQEAQVSGARNAIAYSLSILRTVQPTVRSAPLLAIYASMFLADGLEVPVHAAKDGIDAQLKLHSLPSEENIDDLYTLLEEFGAVLHVDVPDLLNRSDDRAKTLDAYTVGLNNITERSKRRSADLADQIATLKTDQKTRKAAVIAVDKEVKAAVKDKDFATAQDRQKELADAQTALTQTDLQFKEMTSIQQTLDDLLTIAAERIAALNGNREVLIAGLKVADIPGVEDLGVIAGKKAAKKRGGFSPFGGL